MGTAPADNPKLYDLVLPGEASSLLPELTLLGGRCAPDLSPGFLEQTYRDTRDLYAGRYPGYRASNTKYHDVEHASAVGLAMLRLLHGAAAEDRAFSGREVELAAAAALLHDSGLIQTRDDTQGTGAKYTVGHERRSADFARRYLAGRGLAQADIEACCQIIAATQLSRPLDDIPWQSGRIRFLGQLLAAADLLAQMADRQYLEKLLLLYREFEEARLPGFDDELALLKRTEQFYGQVARARLDGELERADRFMRPHFRARWSLDRDLYAEAIANNLAYLRQVLALGQDCSHRELLRRGGIVQSLDEQECPEQGDG